MIHKNTHQTIKFGLAKEETSKSEFNEFGTLKLKLMITFLKHVK